MGAGSIGELCEEALKHHEDFPELRARKGQVEEQEGRADKAGEATARA